MYNFTQIGCKITAIEVKFIWHIHNTHFNFWFQNIAYAHFNTFNKGPFINDLRQIDKQHNTNINFTCYLDYTTQVLPGVDFIKPM